MEPINRYFNHISRAVRKESGNASRLAGLGPGEMRTMRFIHHNPGTTQSEISQKFGINKAATARQCKALEEKGMIERVRNESDGRSWLLYPSESESQFKEEAHMNENRIYDRLMEDFTKEEKEELARLLAKMCEKIEFHKGGRQ